MVELCSIAGVICKTEKVAFELIYEMLKVLQHREPDGVGVSINGKVTKSKKIEELEPIEGNMGIGSIKHIIIDDRDENYQPIESDKNCIVFNGEIYNSNSIRDKLKLNSFRIDNDAEIVLHLFERLLSSNGSISAIKKMFKIIDGIFTFAILHNNKIILARDPIGVKSLFLVENSKYIGFASERKALWKIGLKNGIHSVAPGSFCFLTKSGKTIPFKGYQLKRQPKLNISLTEISTILDTTLHQSTKKRIINDKIGLLFSGGLDSSILAKYCSTINELINFRLFCAGLKGSRDVENAKETAELLNLPTSIHEFDSDDLEKYIPYILYLIEEPDVMKLGISLPTYFATKLAHHQDFKILLSGQGADELFGGYYRYIQIVKEKGYHVLQNNLWKDICNISTVSLNGCDLVGTANSMELRFPYLSTELIEFGMKIPPNFKIFKSNGKFIRKYILRQVGKKIGLPERIFSKPKIALQYGSGAHKTLEKIARKNGFNKSLAKKYGYRNYIKMYLDVVGYLLNFPEIPHNVQKVIEELDEENKESLLKSIEDICEY